MTLVWLLVNFLALEGRRSKEGALSKPEALLPAAPAACWSRFVIHSTWFCAEAEHAPGGLSIERSRERVTRQQIEGWAERLLSRALWGGRGGGERPRLQAPPPPLSAPGLPLRPPQGPAQDPRVGCAAGEGGGRDVPARCRRAGGPAWPLAPQRTCSLWNLVGGGGGGGGRHLQPAPLPLLPIWG